MWGGGVASKPSPQENSALIVSRDLKCFSGCGCVSGWVAGGVLSERIGFYQGRGHVAVTSRSRGFLLIVLVVAVVCVLVLVLLFGWVLVGVWVFFLSRLVP